MLERFIKWLGIDKELELDELHRLETKAEENRQAAIQQKRIQAEALIGRTASLSSAPTVCPKCGSNKLQRKLADDVYNRCDLGANRYWAACPMDRQLGLIYVSCGECQSGIGRYLPLDFDKQTTLDNLSVELNCYYCHGTNGMVYETGRMFR